MNAKYMKELSPAGQSPFLDFLVFRVGEKQADFSVE